MLLRDTYETAVFCAKTIEEVVFACSIIGELAADKCILMFFVEGVDDKQCVDKIVKLFSWDKAIYVEGLALTDHKSVSQGWYSRFKYNIKLNVFNRCSIKDLVESSLSKNVMAKKGRGSAVFFTSYKHVLDQNVMGLMPKAERCWFSSRAGDPTREYIENNPEIFQARGRQARRISTQNMSAGMLFESLVIKYSFRVIGEGKYFVPFDGIDYVYASSNCETPVPVVSVAGDSLLQAIKLIQDTYKGTEEIENSICNILPRD